MSLGRLAAVFCLFLNLAAGCGRAPLKLSEGHAAAIRDSVQATLDTYREHFAAKAWDSVVGSYANDSRFTWVEDGVVRYRSAAEIRQALETIPPTMQVETTYSDMEISALAPGVASVITHFETRFADSAGAGYSFDGVITMTLVHGTDGWRFFGGHTSSPKRRGP